MDKNEKKRLDNPRQGANFLSIVSFKWLLKTYRTGYKRPLDETDLYPPLDEDSSESLGNKISELWNKEQERCQKLDVKCAPSLSKVLARCFGLEIAFYGLFVGILELGIRTTQPFIFMNLLKYFSGTNGITRTEATYWASGLVAGIVLECVIFHTANQALTHVGMKMRLACSSLIYRKILRVRQAPSKGQADIKKIINLMNDEVSRLERLVPLFHYIWIAPIQTGAIMYLLYRDVDLAAAGGVIVFFIFATIYGLYGKFVSHLTVKLVHKTEKRLKLTNEIISGIKLIKMYAWEKPFSVLLNKAREKEIKGVRNSSTATEMIKSLEKLVPRLSLFVTILLYILCGNDISAQKVFLITAYYNVLCVVLYRLLPRSIKDLTEASRSVDRIRKFMQLEEIEPNASIATSPDCQLPANVALSFKNVTAKWSSSCKTDALKNVTFEVKTGSLTAIVGRAGAGKTALFQAALNEMGSISGKVKINGDISYASQEPWIFAGTIKENILFGQPIDLERYARVISMCQLRRDFELLPHGEDTVVGEKGINLRAGQWARINLARAIYREADVYLLDGVFATVDTHVGKAIFDICIRTYLKDKTVLLITRQLQYLNGVDDIVVIENGTVQEDGSYGELLNSDVLKKLPRQVDFGDRETYSSIFYNNNATKDEVVEPVIDMSHEFQPFNDDEQERLENRRFGSINVRTYLGYFGATGNACLVLLVFLVAVLFQVLSTGADYFVTYWMNVEDRGLLNFTTVQAGNDDALRGRGWFVYVYSWMIALVVVFMFLRVLSFYHMCMRISRNLHDNMFTSILYTTMDFFNSNPIGRIMNRFSKDVAAIDTRIPQALMDVTQIGLYVVAVVFITVSVDRWLIGPAFVIFLMCYYLRLFYVKTSRSVKRLEGATRSPILNHLSASVQGLTTIRALKAQTILTKEFDNRQDRHSTAWFIFFSGSRALGFYVQLFFTIFVTIVIYSLLFAQPNKPLAGDVGLVISQCLLLLGLIQIGVRQSTELESHMFSVERILDYSKLPSETAEEASSVAVPEDWPSEGKVAFDRVSLIYDRQDRPSLRGLSFAIESKERLGIVGRAGAGKSSIINAIFRLVSTDGAIHIDDLPIDQIPLQELRSRISIVPQEPVLFSGSIRRNLDPFDQHNDHCLCQALEDVELKAILDSDLGLDTQVTEGGSNFSVSQRQLLCLAGAIVRRNKILILDEATANNVDSRADQLVQKVIRRKFWNCTVVIIAHRLNTIMDCDKIIVMEAGEVVEFDHPFNLLRREGGVFYNMIRQLDSYMSTNLYEIAKCNYERETVRL